MHHPLRALALSLAIAATPACASLQIGETRLENPAAAARTLDQRAYAILNAYAAVIEEATDIVRDPAAPISFKRALSQAERVATPAAETLEIAVVAYIRARGDFEAASGATQPTLERAATALTIAARRLSEAMQAAEAPISELEDLVGARRG
ncbi:hypothetical protein [Terricaulis silvestris]|uniref:Uncharacterized protein n=1 Tax=Terricaulis silvestris TaxID=2686094 RepID=A0A6I6MLI8_9CAUL|nr:hypothetical protein [Terricaulis silvestris]QGZ95539.1 hypothetical protein DSM104635_02389 [Terricaulis silvestris]